MAKGANQKIHLSALAISFVGGTTLGLLVAGGVMLRNYTTVGHASGPKPVAGSLDHDELVKLDPSAFVSFCQSRESSVQDCLGTGKGTGAKCAEFEAEAHIGTVNLQALLPLAKQLVIEELGSRGYRSSPMKRRIAAVSRIVVDDNISEIIEVDQRYTSEIRVAHDSVGVLTSEDTAILVLAHELTHIAARHGYLHRMINDLAQNANLLAGIKPTVDQKEDFACDYIGAEVLKRFIRQRPMDLTTKERLSRALGIELPSERLVRSLEEFCAAYRDDLADRDHLGTEQTFNAIIATDPELGR